MQRGLGLGVGLVDSMLALYGMYISCINIFLELDVILELRMDGGRWTQGAW
jgi:hypothetical protein